MSSILNLRIKKEAELSAIRENQKLQYLPSEVVEEIISVLGDEIDMNNVDDFWISLGIDLNNIDNLRVYCRNILLKSFRRSKPDLLGNLFRELISKLDDMVAINYPANLKIIHSKEGIPIKINNIFKGDNVFAISYYKCTKHNKNSITLKNKEYIETFIEKTSIYLDYLKKNVHRFPIKSSEKKTVQSIHKELTKIINIINKKINKLSNMINTINIQD